MNRKHVAFLIAGLFLTAATVTPALADSSSEPLLNRVVRLGDLDLSTEAGVSTLYKRISIAAWNVCRVITPATNGPQGIENAKCRRTLIDEAVTQVNSPALTARNAKNRSELTANR